MLGFPFVYWVYGGETQPTALSPLTALNHTFSSSFYLLYLYDNRHRCSEMVMVLGMNQRPGLGADLLKVSSLRYVGSASLVPLGMWVQLILSALG